VFFNNRSAEKTFSFVNFNYEATCSKLASIVYLFNKKKRIETCQRTRCDYKSITAPSFIPIWRNNLGISNLQSAYSHRFERVSNSFAV